MKKWFSKVCERFSSDMVLDLVDYIRRNPDKITIKEKEDKEDGVTYIWHWSIGFEGDKTVEIYDMGKKSKELQIRICPKKYKSESFSTVLKEFNWFEYRLVFGNLQTRIEKTTKKNVSLYEALGIQNVKRDRTKKIKRLKL